MNKLDYKWEFPLLANDSRGLTKAVSTHSKGITMNKLFHTLAGFALILLFCAGGLSASNTPVGLNPAHPETYTVVKGDTLWDIAGRFLQEPWRWPEVWQANPQIENPDLIYPGDRIVLSIVGGQPRLGLQPGTVRLEPKIRSAPLDDAIPTIPLDAIQQFLSRSYALDRDGLKNAPYVVDFADDHIVGGTGIRVYARSINSPDVREFEVVRSGAAFRDPDTNEILGYEALYVGDATLLDTGDPATLMLARTRRESLLGDRLVPITGDREVISNFQPKPPAKDVRGNIISVLDGVTQIGQYNVVVISRGTDDGLEVGDVLAIDQRGETVRDVISSQRGDRTKLPDEEAGVLMVFRTFPRISFGLVMRATKPLHVMDIVRNP
jgi:LysM repeat protein